MNKLATETLMKLGVPCHVKGFTYLKEAVSHALEDITILHGGVTTVLYPVIAEKFGSTDSRVERAIRHAIELAWTEDNLPNIKAILGPAANRKKMANAEFIATVAEVLRLESMQKAS